MRKRALIAFRTLHLNYLAAHLFLDYQSCAVEMLQDIPATLGFVTQGNIGQALAGHNHSRCFWFLRRTATEKQCRANDTLSRNAHRQTTQSGRTRASPY